MIDNALHDGFDRWLEEFVASGKNEMYVLRGECAEARLRCVDGAIQIAVFVVGSEHQQQGVFTAFLEHCEATGRAIVVELVEGEDFGGSWRAGRATSWKRRDWRLCADVAAVRVRVGGRVVPLCPKVQRLARAFGCRSAAYASRARREATAT